MPSLIVTGSARFNSNPLVLADFDDILSVDSAGGGAAAILLEDGSFVLQEDGTSHVLVE
jgi:hypothetical protein